ncbi:MAG: hypothetical protein CMM01_18145 [Rhodopirellula sp.]|nr:hypothetical protein [Rhodopirellula sp.]
MLADWGIARTTADFCEEKTSGADTSSRESSDANQHTTYMSEGVTASCAIFGTQDAEAVVKLIWAT